MALQRPQDTIPQLLKFCDSLSNVHNWKYHTEYIDQMISAIILFPPWAENVTKHYHSPLIVDATFTAEDLRFTHAVVIDGERHTQIVGLVIRGTEDSKAYSYLFKFVHDIIGDAHITIMADMARESCKKHFPQFIVLYIVIIISKNLIYL